MIPIERTVTAADVARPKLVRKAFVDPPEAKQISEPILLSIVRWGDVALPALAALLAHVVLSLYLGTIDPRDTAIAAFAGALVSAHVMQRPLFGSVDSLRLLSSQVREVTLAWTIVVAVVLAGWLLIGQEAQYRSWALTWYFSGLVLLLGSRVTVASLIARWTRSGHLVRHVAILGAGELGQRLIERLMQEERYGARVVGIFDDRKERVPARIGGMPIQGRSDDLIAFVRRHRVDTVVVALPLSAEKRMLEIVHRLRQLPIDVRVLTDFVGFHVPNRPVSYVGGVPVINVFDRPIKDWKAVGKAIEDRVIAALALLLVSPVLLAVAAWVRLDSPGPALFKQRRLGFNNKQFEIYKFRTMYADKADADAKTLATRNDPRITRLGAWLRRLSIDELPQLLNVLRGDMSLVGPRPHALHAKAADRYYDDVVAGYAARHRVKPGITGWAQVSGWRGETDTAEKIQARVEHDLYYIDNWSIGFDLWILVLTVVKGIAGKNAY
jgi:Undecaprenyl-phosphate glucose phosphotransferase